jgi:hypothetical protein
MFVGSSSKKKGDCKKLQRPSSNGLEMGAVFRKKKSICIKAFFFLNDRLDCILKTLVFVLSLTIEFNRLLKTDSIVFPCLGRFCTKRGVKLCPRRPRKRVVLDFMVSWSKTYKKKKKKKKNTGRDRKRQGTG